ncbi:ABC transporter permease [Rhizobium mongolense]|uniref:Sulfonate transport system permease protein n=2 Tax=Rhizobium mongolense TaxID=57676 RepID=A0ABR6IZC3_9HYPH|nr:ABC transporter permease [Rhizobium mongolense]MBB4233128.1 sulfonate transport system permease protein [Rhizobium mongolense]TVZ75258.1 sulfonate transport system permease protein [Rhizobium mongolense USDA 1844]
MTLTTSANRPVEQRLTNPSGVLADVAYAMTLPLVLLLAWEFSARLGWLPEQILPAPKVVWATIVELWRDGSLIDHTFVSLRRVAVGFTIGALSGLLAGALLGLLPGIRAFVWPIFTAVAQVNTLAWVPLLVLFVGIDEELKYVCIAWSTAIPVILATTRGIADVSPNLVELGRVFDFTPVQRISAIVLPAALPSLFTGLREGLAAAWQSLVIVELFASFEGLGYLMTWGRQLFQMELVIAAMLVIAVIGLSLNAILEYMEGFVQPWKTEALHGR